MNKPLHETQGFERDVRQAIERWRIDKQLKMPPEVLATFVIGSLVGLETANRRADEIRRAAGEFA